MIHFIKSRHKKTPHNAIFANHIQTTFGVGFENEIQIGLQMRLSPAARDAHSRFQMSFASLVKPMAMSLCRL